MSDETTVSDPVITQSPDGNISIALEIQLPDVEIPAPPPPVERIVPMPIPVPFPVYFGPPADDPGIAEDDEESEDEGE